MAKHPVVVYGASGYTGMLTMDWLIDQNIPFTAVARNAKRAQEMMAQRVVRLESATYEIIEAEHNVESLTKAFKGAKVVCNTVGPFINFGLVGVEAALKAGCHHLDTTGEQVLHAQGARAVRRALTPRPACWSRPRLPTCTASPKSPPNWRWKRRASMRWKPPPCAVVRAMSAGVSVGSAASIFELFRSEQCYLWENKLVPHPVTASFNIVDPNFIQPVFSLPWGGTSLPIYFEHDPRVRSCISSVGFYDNHVMPMVHGLSQKWDAEYKHLPKEQQDAVVKSLVESTTPTMPPRERTTLQRSVDVAIGRGQLAAVRATVHGVTPYISTGALQTAAVRQAARWRNQQGRLCLRFQGLWPPLPARLPGAARPGARQRGRTLPGRPGRQHGHHRLLRPRLAYQPHRGRLYPGRACYTFNEVGELSCRIANHLLDLGLPKETKGAIWAANDVTAWTCTLGLWRANMTWIPVEARNSVADNHYILDAFDCEVMFYHSSFEAVIAELRPTLPKIRHWVCVDAAAMTPIYIAGIAMTVFGRHIERSLESLAREALEGALGDAGCSRADPGIAFIRHDQWLSAGSNRHTRSGRVQQDRH